MEHELRLLYIVLGLLSFLAAAFVVITYAVFPHLRNRSWNANLVLVAVCDMCLAMKLVGNSLWDVVGTATEGNLCIFLAAWGSFFAIGTICWNILLCLDLFILFRDPFWVLKGKEVLYFVCGFGVPFVCTLIPLVRNDFGLSEDDSCYTKDDAYLVNLFTGVPVVLLICVAVVTFAYISLRRQADIFQEGAIWSESVLRDLSVYIGWMIIVFTGPAVCSVWSTVGHPPNWAKFANALGISLQGVGNCWVWLLQSGLLQRGCARRKWAISFRRLRQSRALAPPPSLSANMSPLSPPAAPSSMDSLSSFADASNGDSVFRDMSRLAIVRRTLQRSKVLALFAGLDHCLGCDDDSAPGGHSSPGTGDEDAFQQSQRWCLQYHEGAGFTFESHAGDMFRRLRGMYRIHDDDFAASWDPDEMARRFDQESSGDGGRSGAIFVFSNCKRFILKTLDEAELAVFLNMLPHYFGHFRKYPNTLLTKIFGCYTVCLHRVAPVHVLCLSNTFCNARVDVTYDLKGSWVARSVGGSGVSVRKDMDLHRPLVMAPMDHAAFMRTLAADTLFLQQQGIMDYSILLGVRERADDDDGDDDEADDDTHDDHSVAVDSHNQPRRMLAAYESPIVSADGREEFYVAIIDILQAWTMNKRMERWWKTCCLRKDSRGVSAMAPQAYRRRFCNAMSLAFVREGSAVSHASPADAIKGALWRSVDTDQGYDTHALGSSPEYQRAQASGVGRASLRSGNSGGRRVEMTHHPRSPPASVDDLDTTLWASYGVSTSAEPDPNVLALMDQDFSINTPEVQRLLGSDGDGDAFVVEDDYF